MRLSWVTMPLSSSVSIELPSGTLWISSLETVRMSDTASTRMPTHLSPTDITTTTWFLVGEVTPSPKRARRSKIGTIVPRRLITPRTNSRVLGSGVAPFQARISRTVVISTP